MNPDGTLKWRYPLGRPNSHSPVVAWDGTIYVSPVPENRGTNWLTLAINPDGTLKWSYPVPGHTPTIGLDGTVYFPRYDQYFYALNADGTLKWRVKTLGDAFSMAALGWDGTIYVTHGTHRVIGFLTAVSRDGVMKQQIQLSSPTSAIAVGRDGTLYFGGFDRYVYALGTRGGLHLKWRYRTGDTTESSPALAADGRLYIGLRDGQLYAIKD
jgi:outer membrane protein assembly factor BamB